MARQQGGEGDPKEAALASSGREGLIPARPRGGHKLTDEVWA
jgi:hypothetical protein